MTATKETLTKETVNDFLPRPVGELKRDRKFNLLVYGEPGAGKTHLAGSADEIPSWRSVLHLDIGGGSSTLDPVFPRVESVPVTSWGQLKTQYDRLYFGELDYDRFNTVVIDHITETQKLCQRWIMEGAIERAARRGKDDDLEEDVPRQRDYLVMYERMMAMLRDFRDLDINFICTAHVKEDVNQRTLMRKLKPSLSGAAKSDIPGLFDIVAFLHTEKVDGKDVRLFSTKDTPDYVAKQRGLDLPEHMADTTIEEILSYVPQEGVKP